MEVLWERLRAGTLLGLTSRSWVTDEQITPTHVSVKGRAKALLRYHRQVALFTCLLWFLLSQQLELELISRYDQQGKDAWESTCFYKVGSLKTKHRDSNKTPGELDLFGKVSVGSATFTRSPQRPPILWRILLMTVQPHPMLPHSTLLWQIWLLGGKIVKRMLQAFYFLCTHILSIFLGACNKYINYLSIIFDC